MNSTSLLHLGASMAPTLELLCITEPPDNDSCFVIAGDQELYTGAIWSSDPGAAEIYRSSDLAIALAESLAIKHPTKQISVISDYRTHAERVIYKVPAPCFKAVTIQRVTL